MRIFTLGKNGIPLFLFALMLFTGTYSSYGQECPTVDDATQYFCDYADFQVRDLVASGSGTIIWYAEADDTEPLPESANLIHNEDYFAEIDGQTCATRPSVTVVLYSAPQVLGIKEGTKRPQTKQSLTLLPFCVSDVNNSGLFLSDIRTDAIDQNTIQWYTSSTGSTILPANTQLENGVTYWVDQGNPNGTCRSGRTSVTIQLNQQPTPTGATSQSFCFSDDPLYSDIVVSGDNRYYTAAEGGSQIAAEEALPVGTRTIYVSSTEEGETCESDERLAVTVTVTATTEIESTQEFCSSIGTGNEGGPPTVAALTPEGTSWFLDAELTEPVASTELLVDDEVYYSDIANSCDVNAVTVNLLDAPNAGRTSEATYCQNIGVIDLYGDIAHVDGLGAPDTDGTFNSTDITFTGTTFNTDNVEPGTYVFDYVVEGSTACPDDFSQMTLTILEAPEAGENVDEEFCATNFEDDPTALLAEFSSYFIGRDGSGTIDDNTTSEVETIALEDIATTLVDQFEAGQRDFSLTFNVENENCTSEALINVTFGEAPFAGDGGTIQLESGVTNTTTLTEANAGDEDTSGTWTAPDGTSVTGDLAPSEPGAYVYTVTVGECTASATVTVLAACPELDQEDLEQSFCASIAEENGSRKPTIEDLTPADVTWYASADATDELAATTELVDGTVYYAGYAAGDCANRTGVTVTFFDTPNAGSTTEEEFCVNAGAVNLVDYIDDSILGAADRNGTFEPALTDNMFDPEEWGVGVHNFEYTVEGNENCPTDLASIQVTVLAAPNAGENGVITLIEGEESTETLIDALGGTPDTGGTWENDATGDVVDGTFAPQAPGSYTYTVTAGQCSASATVTVELETTTEPTCPEVTEANQTFCSPEVATVAQLLPAGATWYDAADATEALDAETALEDGKVYYAGNPEGDCTARQSVTVTFTTAPAAPTVTATSFCASEGATVADLAASVTGDRTLYYTDEALSTLANSTDVLVNGDYYVTQSTQDGCESEAAVLTVTLTDAPTPTLAADGNVFCEYDNPTIGDLEENITSSGTITWYNASTDGIRLSSVEALQNGVTYYASLTDDSSACESSVRLSVTVTLESCDLVIPEAFSPNGDGINDTFEIQHLGEEFPNYTIEIFNRWGNVVFKGNSNTPNWNGVSTEARTLGDQVVPVGVYFYIVNYNDGQTAPTQGRFYLSR